MNINNSTTKLVFKDEKPDSVISTTRYRQPNILIKYLNNYSKLIIDLDKNTTQTTIFKEDEANDIKNTREEFAKYSKINDEAVNRLALERKAQEVREP